MTEQDRDWMERYIYQVVRRLPKNQREEIRLELRELIEDMWEQSKDMTGVLKELGDPIEFAKQYRGNGGYVIGPEYYDTYFWLLKVVLLCSLIPVVVFGLFETFYEGFSGVDLQTTGDWVRAITQTIAGGLGSVIANVMISGLGGIGSVTLIFLFLERKEIRLEGLEGAISTEKLFGTGAASRAEGVAETEKAAAWTPEALSPLPDKRAMINRGDTIVGIVFLVLLSVLLIFAPKVFSAFLMIEEELVIVPFFNLGKWQLILPFFLASLLVGLADEIVKLVAGVYNRVVLISAVVSNVLQIILGVLLLLVFPFWNPNFTSELSSYVTGEPERFWHAFLSWDGRKASLVILVILCIIALAEIGVTAYKTIQYEKKN